MHQARRPLGRPAQRVEGPTVRRDRDPGDTWNGQAARWGRPAATSPAHPWIVDRRRRAMSFGRRAVSGRSRRLAHPVTEGRSRILDAAALSWARADDARATAALARAAETRSDGVRATRSIVHESSPQRHGAPGTTARGCRRAFRPVAFVHADVHAAPVGTSGGSCPAQERAPAHVSGAVVRVDRGRTPGDRPSRARARVQSRRSLFKGAVVPSARVACVGRCSDSSEGAVRRGSSRPAETAGFVEMEW
jgi:hypothetical protein